jgi:ribosome-associated translation inhibitor RaiA
MNPNHKVALISIIVLSVVAVFVGIGFVVYFRNQTHVTHFVDATLVTPMHYEYDLKSKDEKSSKYAAIEAMTASLKTSTDSLALLKKTKGSDKDAIKKIENEIAKLTADRNRLIFEFDQMVDYFNKSKLSNHVTFQSK